MKKKSNMYTFTAQLNETAIVFTGNLSMTLEFLAQDICLINMFIKIMLHANK